MTTQGMAYEEASRLGVPLYSPDGVNWYPATGEVDITAIYQATPEFANLVAEGKAIAPSTITEMPTTAPVLTDSDIQNIDNQITYWESQVKLADENLSLADSPDFQLDREQIQKEKESYQAKIDILKQYKEAGVALTPEVSIITSPAMQPYITLSKEGTYSVDVQGIIRSGMDPMQVKQLGINDETIAQINALNKLITYKTAGGGYYVSKALEDGKESTLLAAGFSKEQIADVKKQMAEQKELATTSHPMGGHEVTEIEEYKTGNGYDIAKYLRDNQGTLKNAEDYLGAEGFSKEAIENAEAYNAQPWRQTTAQDRLYLKAYQIGLDMTGEQSPEDAKKALDKDPSFLDLPATDPKVIGLKPTMSERAFIANFVDARINQPEYSTLGDKTTVTKLLKNMGAREYMRLYGKGTALASQGTDVLTVIAPAAKALHPEYQFRDVTGAEWALSAANITLLVVAPVLGKVAGTGVKAVSGIKAAVETGAALTYPVVTAVQWAEMSTTERIINVAIDTTIVGAVLGKPITGAFKQLVPGIGFEKRVEALTRAVRSGDATEIWIAGDRLEAYGTALEDARISGGLRIKKQGRFVKENANAIAKSKTSGQFSKLDPVINDLHNINEEMALLRQKGALAIDPKTGKIYDTETGEEMTLARQTERIRTARETRVGTLPITRAESEALGLTDDEIAEILKIAGDDRELFLKLAREKAAKNAKMLESFNKMLEENAKKYEAKKTAESKSITPEEEAAERWGEESANLQDTLRQVKQMNAEAAKREAERIATIERAAREVSRERAYRILFPSRVSERAAQATPEPERQVGTTRQPMTVPFVEPVTREVTAPSTREFEKPITKIAPAVREQEKTKTAVYPYPETETQTKVAPQVQTKTATQTKPQTETQTKTITKPQTVTVTETITPPVVNTGGGGDGGGGGGGDGGNKPKPTPKIRLPSGSDKRVAKLPKGSIAWKQGMGWWIIVPPYGIANRHFSFHEPEGAEVHKNAKSAYDTIQTFKGKEVTDVIPKHDMGVFDVHVTKPPVSPTRRNRAAIKFTRDPQFTNKPRQKSTVKNRKVGTYYVAGNMVSRHPIGKRRRS